MEITAKTKIIDALQKSDKFKDIFKIYNLHCLGCKGISEDTIEKVAYNNGLDIVEFLNEINRMIK